MNRLGIELLTVFGLPPVEFIELASELGCGHISFALSQFPMDPYGSPAWSVREDRKLQQAIKDAVRRTGVQLSLGEGFAIREGVSASSFAADLELMRELGVRRVNTVSMDPERTRSFDEIAQFAELADKVQMEATVEFAPGLTIADLPTALEVVRYVNRPNFRLLVDSMHLIRSGSNVADLAALDPDLIGYAQLSDAPLRADMENYMQEATFARSAPGEGELPLQGIVNALPEHCVISIEAPNKAYAEQASSPKEWARRCVRAARKLGV